MFEDSTGLQSLYFLLSLCVHMLVQVQELHAALCLWRSENGLTRWPSHSTLKQGPLFAMAHARAVTFELLGFASLATHCWDCRHELPYPALHREFKLGSFLLGKQAFGCVSHLPPWPQASDSFDGYRILG